MYVVSFFAAMLKEGSENRRQLTEARGGTRMGGDDEQKRLFR